jgi:hypothetical protein
MPLLRQFDTIGFRPVSPKREERTRSLGDTPQTMRWSQPVASIAVIKSRKLLMSTEVRSMASACGRAAIVPGDVCTIHPFRLYRRAPLSIPMRLCST